MTTNSIQPKRRFKISPIEQKPRSREEAAVAHKAFSRPSRMKRSGHPHQLWINPSSTYAAPVEQLPVGPALHELLALFARAYLRPVPSPHLR
jgi:hypothetical protein